VSVRPDENAPAIGLDAVEDDGRGLCRAGQRLVAKTPLELGHEVAQLIIRQLRDVAAQQSKSLSRLRETGSIASVSTNFEAARTFAPNSFGVLTISPELAHANLPTMTYLGQR